MHWEELNSMTLKQIEDEAAKEAAKSALRAEGNVEKAAHRLGISVSTLYRRLRKWGLYGDRRLKINTLVFRLDQKVPRGN